jgi:hypothetical protein
VVVRHHYLDPDLVRVVIQHFQQLLLLVAVVVGNIDLMKGKPAVPVEALAVEMQTLPKDREPGARGIHPLRHPAKEITAELRVRAVAAMAVAAVAAHRLLVELRQVVLVVQVLMALRLLSLAHP